MLHDARQFFAVSALLAIAFLLGARSPSAEAGILFVVDSTADAVDAVPGDGVCATSGNECTVRAAVQESNGLAGPATINVPPGTYTLAIPGDEEDDSATGDLDITDDLTFDVTGAGAADTIIDGGGLDRVVDIHSGTVEIRDLTIQHGNEASGQGGGGVRTFGVLNLLRSRVILNSTTSDAGGILNQSNMTIAQTTIDSNHADRYTGGVYNGGDAEIVDSTISNNVADVYNGGVANNASLAILNSTISGNSATNLGGVFTSGGTTRITNSTVVNNEGGTNGGLRIIGGGVEIGNTIVANNSGDNCLIYTEAGASLSSLGHNLGGDETCELNGAGDLENSNPLTGPLMDNGGFTNTHALLQGSPAVDAGDDALCPGQDQRGTARPQGAHCDIGAYEADGSEPGGQEVAWGDSDCDGDITTRDNQALLRKVLLQNALSQTEPCPDLGSPVPDHTWGDWDCDGDVTTRDNQALLRKVLLQTALSQTEPCPDLGTVVDIS